MSKTDKQLRYFVNALLKYAEKDGHSNPGFTTEQIPEIFKGWTKLEFNIAHHGAGVGCCTCIGPDRYQINKAHCVSLKNRFKDSYRTKWRLIISIIALAIMLIGTIITILRYRNDYNETTPDNKENKNVSRQLSVAPQKK